MRKELEFFKKQEPILNARIERGIDENRKGTATITIVDHSGNSVSDASVRIIQKTHDFKFGGNIFMLDGFENESDTQKYKDCFKELFNLAVVPFYWGDLEPVEGKPRFSKDSEKIYRRPAPDLVLDFCREYGIEPKGHTLMWHYLMPTWLSRDSEDMKEKIDKRFREISEKYADKIKSWDVVNEPLVKHTETGYVFPKDYVDWTFRRAEKYFGCNRLFINDVTRMVWEKSLELSAYSLLIENMLLKNIKLDGIGLQYHMFYKKDELHTYADTFFNPQPLLDVLDNYSRFNLPVHISEVTIPSYEMDSDSELLQAELTEYLYRLWFSHSSVEAIVWWNLIDGHAYSHENYYNGGLLNKDFSPKASYKVLQRLINKEWHTEMFCEKIDKSIILNGFYGEYEVNIRHEGKEHQSTIHLSKTGPRQFEIKLGTD